MTERPLRIAYVLSLFHPVESGAERQALAQGEELVRRGHRVRVVTQMPEGRDLAPVEDVRGVLVERVVRPIRRGPLFGLSFVWGMARALKTRRREIDLVHTHQALWESISCGFAREWLKGVPTLIQPASSGYFGEAQEMMRTKGAAVLRRLALRNTEYVAISEDIEREWMALGVPASKMRRLMSGVDTNRFHPGVREEREGSTRVVFTGRLHPQKNLDVLLRAWPEVVRATGARLVLVGDGPDRTRLEALTRELGVADWVEFAGAVEDPSGWLRGASAFVLPSLCEGMSNSLLEAMATGLPCVVSDVGGNVDLVEEGRSGRLVGTGDVAGWSRAVIEVLGDREAGKRMGKEGLGRIEREFALGRVVDRYVGMYRELVGRRGGAEGNGETGA